MWILWEDAFLTKRCFDYFSQDDHPKMRVLILSDSTILPRFTPSLLLKDVQRVNSPLSSYLQKGDEDSITKATKRKDTTTRLNPDLVKIIKLVDDLTTTGDLDAVTHHSTTKYTVRSNAARLVGAIVKVCMTAKMTGYQCFRGSQRQCITSKGRTRTT